jgi:chemotaxis protein CheX
MDSATAEKLRREYLKPFVDGVTATLSTMAGLTPTIKGIKIVTRDRFSGDVSAVMGVVGERGEGFVGISFGYPLAAIAVGRILDLAPDELEDSDINDGVGELINMIAGSAKNALLGTPYKFQAGLPNVITGREHEVAYPKNAECWKATLEAEGHDFHLHVAYAPIR